MISSESSASVQYINYGMYFDDSVHMSSYCDCIHQVPVAVITSYFVTGDELKPLVR